MILKLGVKHLGMELYKVCINHDPGNEQIDRRFMFKKIFWAQGVVCPCPGAIYMYMTIILKHLL